MIPTHAAHLKAAHRLLFIASSSNEFDGPRPHAACRTFFGRQVIESCTLRERLSVPRLTCINSPGAATDERRDETRVTRAGARFAQCAVECNRDGGHEQATARRHLDAPVRDGGE